MIRIVHFICPQTGERADALVPGAAEEKEVRNDPHREVLCFACGWFHSIDPYTGKVLGERET